MIHKTKAAMQGRQCHYQKLKQSQDTRVNAGGQSLSAPVIAGTAPLARFGGMSKSGHYRQGYTIFSAHLQTTHKLGCLGYTALAHTPFPQIWGDLDKRAGSTAMQHTPEISRSFDRYPDFGYHSLSASLAFLRWRRLICTVETPASTAGKGRGFTSISGQQAVVVAWRKWTPCRRLANSMATMWWWWR